MSIKQITLTTLALFILGACSVDQEELEELFVELETSAESVDYGESFTLTWNSNASPVSYTHLTLPTKRIV